MVPFGTFITTVARSCKVTYFLIDLKRKGYQSKTRLLFLAPEVNPLRHTENVLIPFRTLKNA